MASLAIQSQSIDNPLRDGVHYITSLVNFDNDGDTVDIGERIVSAAVLPGIGQSAPTVTVSGTVATLTGGSKGKTRLTTRHQGNAAGL